MLRLTLDTTTNECDLAVDSFGGLRSDGDISTSVLMSMLIDARPGAADVQSDPLGAGALKLGGWWAVSLLPADVRPERAPGSLLHRLTAYKANAATGLRAERWGEQALAWLVPAGLAERVTAEATVGAWSLSLTLTAYRGAAPLFRQLWTLPAST